MREKLNGTATPSRAKGKNGKRKRAPQRRTDWARVDATTEEEIARHAKEDDTELSDEMLAAMEVRLPAKKTPLSLRLDPDVVAFFKSLGKGYQSRMNAVLRAYMTHAPRGRSR